MFTRPSLQRSDPTWSKSWDDFLVLALPAFGLDHQRKATNKTSQLMLGQ